VVHCGVLNILLKSKVKNKVGGTADLQMSQQQACRLHMCGCEYSTPWMGCHMLANPPSCCLPNKSISTGIYDTVNIHVHANSLINCVAITLDLYCDNTNYFKSLAGTQHAYRAMGR